MRNTIGIATLGALVLGWGLFTATGDDVEDGAIAAVCASVSGSTFALGTTTVSCTVTDSLGSTAPCGASYTLVNGEV